MEKQNAPGREAEGVVCLLPGDTDAYATKPPLLQQQVGRRRRLPGKLTLDTWGLTETELFDRAVREARNRWDIQRRRLPGFIPDKRLSKTEADAKLRLMMRQLIGGRP